MKWTVTTEAEFDRIMEEIDSELRRQSVPVHARQLRGWLMIAERFELNGLRLSPRKHLPQPNVYSGDDLTSHILNWFERRYGEGLNIDYSVGCTILVIRGDAYRVRLPRIFGSARIVCDPAHHKEAFYPKATRFPNILTVNILDSIDALQPGLSKVLRQDELTSISQVFQEYLYKFMNIEKMLEGSADLGAQAQGDLKSSVECIVRVPPEFGSSRWHSLQATEKCLKLFLKRRGAGYPRSGPGGHNLGLLSKLAEQVGLPPISEKNLAEAICDSKVRYGEVSSTLEQAVSAHRSAVSICARAASVA